MSKIGHLGERRNGIYLARRATAQVLNCCRFSLACALARRARVMPKVMRLITRAKIGSFEALLYGMASRKPLGYVRPTAP